MKIKKVLATLAAFTLGAGLVFGGSLAAAAEEPDIAPVTDVVSGDTIESTDEVVELDQETEAVTPPVSAEVADPIVPNAESQKTAPVEVAKGGGKGGGHDPVTFCHKPGTPAQKELTSDDDGFVQGHLGHGDSLSACPPPFTPYEVSARWLLPESWDYATTPTYQAAIFPQTVFTELPCGRWSQDDVYWIKSVADEALYASLDDDGKLMMGEDSAIYKSHTFTPGPECSPPVDPKFKGESYSGTCIGDTGGFTYDVTVGSKGGDRKFYVKNLGNGTGGKSETYYAADGAPGAPGVEVVFTTVAAGESATLTLAGLAPGNYRVVSDGARPIKNLYMFDFTIEEGAEYQSNNPEAPCYVEVPPSTTTNGEWTTPEITCENKVGDELPITRTVTTVTNTLDPKTGKVTPASNTTTENGVYVVTEADIEALDCPVPDVTPSPTPAAAAAKAPLPPLAETGSTLPLIGGALSVALLAAGGLAMFLTRRRIA